MYRKILCTLLLATAVSACQPTGPADTRHISVSGQGEVTAMPDTAEVVFGIEVRDRDLASARDQAEQVVNAALNEFTRIGIPANAIESTGIVTRPEYDYHDGRQEFRGYYVSRSLRVTVEDLERLGPLLDAATGKGITTTQPPQFSVTDPREKYRDALAAAGRDARANAERLAATFGTSVGRVLAIDETGRGAAPSPMMQEMAMRGRSESTQIRIGEIRFEANVSASFELAD